MLSLRSQFSRPPALKLEDIDPMRHVPKMGRAIPASPEIFCGFFFRKWHVQVEQSPLITFRGIRYIALSSGDSRLLATSSYSLNLTFSFLLVIGFHP